MECPECGRGIDCLLNGDEINRFWCPECNRLLFASEEDVIKFLKEV